MRIWLLGSALLCLLGGIAFLRLLSAYSGNGGQWYSAICEDGIQLHFRDGTGVVLHSDRLQALWTKEGGLRISRGKSVQVLRFSKTPGIFVTSDEGDLIYSERLKSINMRNIQKKVEIEKSQDLSMEYVFDISSNRKRLREALHAIKPEP